MAKTELTILIIQGKQRDDGDGDYGQGDQDVSINLTGRFGEEDYSKGDLEEDIHVDVPSIAQITNDPKIGVGKNRLHEWALEDIRVLFAQSHAQGEAA